LENRLIFGKVKAYKKLCQFFVPIFWATLYIAHIYWSVAKRHLHAPRPRHHQFLLRDTMLVWYTLWPCVCPRLQLSAVTQQPMTFNIQGSHRLIRKKFKQFPGLPGRFSMFSRNVYTTLGVKGTFK